MRFIAGIGLAGELGAGITLVSESMHKDARGYGTTIVASVGILGAVVAALVGDTFSWRVVVLHRRRARHRACSSCASASTSRACSRA